jgi:hypothetical protein
MGRNHVPYPDFIQPPCTMNGVTMASTWLLLRGSSNDSVFAFVAIRLRDEMLFRLAPACVTEDFY